MHAFWIKCTQFRQYGISHSLLEAVRLIRHKSLISSQCKIIRRAFTVPACLHYMTCLHYTKCTTPKMNALCRLRCTVTNFVRCVEQQMLYVCCTTETSALLLKACWLSISLAPLGGGGAQRAHPCGFSQIAPEVLGISLWNLPYLSGQQFHTLCQKIRTQVIIGQPWVTSEWRHVSPILINKMGLRKSPPLVQF